MRVQFNGQSIPSVRQERVPFNERGGRLRGCLDAVSGRFPRFVFGGQVGADILPVFHFHDERRADLEPKLRYLAENGYRSVTSEEIAQFVAGRLSPEPRRVGLCFDDAWASLWTVAAPLLRAYGLTAIAYAIPGRIEDGEAAPEGGPFATWSQLRALQASGIVDIQCHTYSHSRVFCSTEVVDYVTPGYRDTPLLNRPQVQSTPSLRFVSPEDLGAPLYSARSRMSDGRRVEFADDVDRRCVEHVAREGGARFFDRRGWRAELDAIVRGAGPDHFGARRPPRAVESLESQRAAIEEELERGRSMLNDKLATRTVNHVCLPWGVSGSETAAALRRLGFRTAFANRLRGVHAVRRGDDPYWLKRLPNKHIFRLPGRGRRTFV
jgi:hypothetical protein